VLFNNSDKISACVFTLTCIFESNTFQCQNVMVNDYFRMHWTSQMSQVTTTVLKY